MLERLARLLKNTSPVCCFIAFYCNHLFIILRFQVFSMLAHFWKYKVIMLEWFACYKHLKFLALRGKHLKFRSCFQILNAFFNSLCNVVVS